MKKSTPSASSNTRKSVKSVKALYAVSALTKNSNANLWVAFPAGKTSKGLVFSSTLTRDKVRNEMSKNTGIKIQDIRAKRVRSFRKATK